MPGPSWEEVAAAWRSDARARVALARELAGSPHRAFAWETVPVSAATSSRPYEHVLHASPALASVSADPSPFREPFRGRSGVVRFRNLGGDAELIAPTPPDRGPGYPHLAAFVRTAPEELVHELWSEVGRAIEERWRASDATIWVSTAGLGVHWLHVRIDSVPKYYRHAPFRVP